MSEPRFILALDQGTTSSRAILFGREGVPVAVAQREFAQHYPQPGWVEHDPREIWQSQLDVAHEVMRNARISAANIAAIGIANQRETTLLWDRATGAPLGPAIVWQDRRTAARCEGLAARGAGEQIRARTGLLIDPYFSATKLAWLLDSIPGARARATRGELAFGTVDSWLVWNLSGGRRHVTDLSNAARTSLLNIHTLDWDDELLALFDIPRALLPELMPSSGMFAETDAALFGAPLPVTGIGGDQQAATFGQACLEAGMAKNTYGTGLFLLMNTGEQPVASQHRMLGTVGWQFRKRTHYALEGSIFMGGAIIQWLRDGLGIIEHAPDVEALAAQCTSSEGVLLVPAFSGLGAPHWDPYARGTLLGMTRGTGRTHIARAALDAIALQTVDVLGAMEADAGIAVSELRVDGGASQCDLLMQIQADLLGRPVVRPEVTETTALGAAYLAGLEIGFWTGLDEIAQQWRAQRRFEPTMSADERAARIGEWRRAIERARAWAPSSVASSNASQDD
ncbi:glycerol kinase GlpK [Burkholderia multivorans]|uniref:glycerol kinase GlpK n=1 Tax=Burkholderia multivorans TaxID=87883 RepID=UPI0019D25B52|nr:glycerol kinase GlpK [Burkholderia multivorans]MBN6738834.1 glycerol kinase GlpK [Burkholderia multivorans]MBN7130107.1 glycerol kinase GlpK [Burkholderia multivorans]MBN8173464.1 glycerol kinase GlpK [Burkholderia multivorans]QSL29510.1 glycerol kinase GlpK [Burkholderia multivorans]